MAIIMSNADKLEFCLFVKFVWEQNRHLEFVGIVWLIY